MNCMCAPDRVRAGFRQSKIANLALAHELCHRPDCFFDRRFGIDPVLVIKINATNTEPAQTGVARFSYIVGLAIDAAKSRSAGVANDSELGRDNHTMAFAANATSKQLFVGVGAGNTGSMEEGGSKLDRALDGSERLRIVPLAIELRHPHTSKPDRRDNWPAASKFSLFHGCP